MTAARHRVSVREFAWLGTEPVAHSLDAAQISESAFDYLCTLSESFSSRGARLVQVEGRRRLRLDNYVGVIETPCGTSVEIVPKHHGENDDLASCRALLRKLIVAQLEITPREVGPAAIQKFHAPLTEWVMQRFLHELETLLRRGLRFDYQRIDEELSFLRGQLDLNAQLRQPPGRDHRFHVRHDVFSSDRPENRLLRAALERVRRATQDPDRWRRVQELGLRLAEVRPSSAIQHDFRAWGSDRLMALYQPIKPWCELVLQQQMPLALTGEQKGLSLLFPMEKLFERFVARWLRQYVRADLEIRAPASSEWLCRHQQSPVFQLEPDILISGEGERWVLDTKWKLLDASDRTDKYGLVQADLYQVFAYGQKYMHGIGRMALIYPKTRHFSSPLAPFDFGGGLELYVLPFDLDQERLIGSARIGIPLTCSAAFTA
jgi:5-methylcytosine-specific restriction enzyme subunit McrC